MKKCETCGQSLPPDYFDITHGAPLKPREARILELVRRAGMQGLRCGELFDRLVGADPEGPDTFSGRKVLDGYLVSINAHITHHGWRIRKTGAGIDGVYVLEQLGRK